MWLCNCQNNGNQREIKDTKRYKTIDEGLQNELAEAYLAFLPYVSQVFFNFETFLLKFQYDEPLIHKPLSVTWSVIC